MEALMKIIANYDELVEKKEMDKIEDMREDVLNYWSRWLGNVPYPEAALRIKEMVPFMQTTFFQQQMKHIEYMPCEILMWSPFETFFIGFKAIADAGGKCRKLAKSLFKETFEMEIEDDELIIQHNETLKKVTYDAIMEQLKDCKTGMEIFNELLPKPPKKKTRRPSY